MKMSLNILRTIDAWRRRLSAVPPAYMTLAGTTLIADVRLTPWSLWLAARGRRPGASFLADRRGPGLDFLVPRPAARCRRSPLIGPGSRLLDCGLYEVGVLWASQAPRGQVTD